DGYVSIFSSDSHRRQVATAATRWRSSIDVASGSSTIWRLMATGIAVEMYASLRIKSMYPDKDSHQRQVATAATRLRSSIDVASGSSTIWRWWLRDCGGDLRSTSLVDRPPSGD
ncbi:MAG: hypothetical protein ACK57Y_14755, partial [Pirellulaceae bacterium]